MLRRLSLGKRFATPGNIPDEDAMGVGNFTRHETCGARHGFAFAPSHRAGVYQSELSEGDQWKRVTVSGVPSVTH